MTTPVAVGHHPPSASSVSALSTFEALWDRNFQALAVTSANDAQPPVVAVHQAKGITLVGTVVEPGRCVGVFRIGPGQVKLAGVGEKIGQATVLEVIHDRATVSWSDRTVTLKLQRVKNRL